MLSRAGYFQPLVVLANQVLVESWLTSPGRVMFIAAWMSIGGGMGPAGVLERLN
jgi:hypothetical protein